MDMLHAAQAVICLYMVAGRAERFCTAFTSCVLVRADHQMLLIWLSCILGHLKSCVPLSTLSLLVLFHVIRHKHWCMHH